METKNVPVYYDDVVVPELQMVIQRAAGSDLWTVSFNSLLTLDAKVRAKVADFKGIQKRQACEDRLALYS